jgi:glycosyltransferase involved in cell wall biosynthesis
MRTKVAATQRVTIIKTVIKQYRLPFFQKLHSVLQSDGIELEVLYGAPSQKESTKHDNIDLSRPLGRCIASRYMWQDRLLLQWPGWRTVRESDLVIVVNANRNLLNLPLLALSHLGLKNVALWGHGQNHQRSERTLRERFKEKLALWPSWWFAYTEATASYLVSLGYSRQHITTINNATDTTGFSAQVDAVSSSDMEGMSKRLNLSANDRIALYCGSLYPEKRIPDMLEAARIVAMREPLFRLVVIGRGPHEGLIRDALKNHTYLRYAGPLFGQDKAICYRLSEFVFNPGLVGLAVLDAFAAGRPLLTFADSLHSPEIAYLDHENNGLLINGDTRTMADTILGLLEDHSQLDRLSDGARKSSAKYCVEDMVSRVREGILQCLGQTLIKG